MSDPVPTLDLRSIEKNYGSDTNPVRVLQGVDFAVDEGEYVAVIGPSGSGKSTLLNIVGCLDRPSAGSYYFAGEDVSNFDDQHLSRVRNTKIGFVFQSFHLISHLSVMENIELPLFYARIPRATRRRRCAELAEMVGLSHRGHHLPTELSGGECQRTAIARALSIDPALLLADEPTGNLDSATSAEIMKLLDNLHAAGRTVVMITHDTEIANAAPRRIALRDGNIENDSRRLAG